MKLLLDTHALLWWLADSELGADVRSTIADPGNLVVVSAISVWEISIKRAIGKLAAPPGIVDAVAASGFEPLSVTGDHAEAAGALPDHHRDPFDRMLIAQAQLEDLVLVSRDDSFRRYGVDVLRC